MKNIEKYYYAITDNLKTKSGQNLGCSVFGIRHGNDYCGDTDCLECCLKNLEWLNSEYKGHVLTDEEKNIVKEMCDVIHRFGGRVIYISKEDFPFNKYQVGICYRSDINNLAQVFHTPLFMDDSFKGMELDKEYTLEELGITCQTQKDN